MADLLLLVVAAILLKWVLELVGVWPKKRKLDEDELDWSTFDEDEERKR